MEKLPFNQYLKRVFIATIILGISIWLINIEDLYFSDRINFYLFIVQFFIFDKILSILFVEKSVLERIKDLTIIFFEGWYLIIKDYRKEKE